MAAMERFPMHPMVQLSALLCMIPLTLENAMMQVGWFLFTPAVDLPVPCCCLQAVSFLCMLGCSSAGCHNPPQAIPHSCTGSLLDLKRMGPHSECCC